MIPMVPFSPVMSYKNWEAQISPLELAYSAIKQYVIMEQVHPSPSLMNYRAGLSLHLSTFFCDSIPLSSATKLYLIKIEVMRRFVQLYLMFLLNSFW